LLFQIRSNLNIGVVIRASLFFCAGLNSAKDFTETAREANLLIQSLDRMLIGLTGQLEGNRQQGLCEAVGKLGQESRAMTDYMFYRAIILCLIFIIGIIIALLVYRYASARLSIKQSTLSSQEGQSCVP
jgi:hypothetical protein